MDRLAAMQAFVRVVESGSFSAVAREAQATQSAVSKQIAALERTLGARLLNRTTRSLALTEEGRRLHGAIAPRALELESGIFSHFSAEEVESFVAMLRRIDAIVLGDGE